MEINYDKKYSGRKLKGSEYAASLNLLVYYHISSLQSQEKIDVIDTIIPFPNKTMLFAWA